ncbi:MAG: hypothetical protein CM1200mP30_25010 [Pseudomonadota bacterium]|nr:MAG: hypothetical protein CM1200mP30_25010 [Pseudomonadota bacterium]
MDEGKKYGIEMPVIVLLNPCVWRKDIVSGALTLLPIILHLKQVWAGQSKLIPEQNSQEGKHYCTNKKSR